MLNRVLVSWRNHVITMPDKKKKSNLLKTLKSVGKKAIKKHASKGALKQRAADFVKGKVEDAAKGKRSKTQKSIAKAMKTPEADIQVSKTIEIGGAKKRKQKKKIKQWEKARKSTKQSEQSKFLALDKQFKNGKRS